MKLYILMGSMVEVPKTPLLYFALSYIICVKYVGIKFDPWMISLLVYNIYLIEISRLHYYKPTYDYVKTTSFTKQLIVLS